jgi:BirA family biotin operon repressor/biotin-[acetyl-CoA-carboxylase] ligase
MTAASAPHIDWLDEVDSTNDAVRRQFADEVPIEQYASLATTNQTAGRGRLEREWIDTPGASLAISTYLEFEADAARTSIGWVTLAAGLALRATLARLAGEEQAARIELKWPNDVLVEGRKTAGLLGEILGVIVGGERFACVVGTGINLRDPQALTTPIPIVAPPAAAGAAFAAAQASEAYAAADALANATALTDLGIRVPAEELAAAYVAELAARIDALIAHDGDAETSGLADELREHLSTLGRRVRVSRLDDADLVGTASGITSTGELLVTDEQGATHTLRVGDVQHLRLAADGSDA